MESLAIANIGLTDHLRTRSSRNYIEMVKIPRENEGGLGHVRTSRR